MRRRACFAVIFLAAAATGCVSPFSEKAEFGITFYCPGAGNLDFGDAGVRRGLERAGFKGQVGTLTWTVGFNPAIDQALRINARIGALALARHIEKYIDLYPGRSVSLVGLSAGTGVAIWALEDLRDGYKVENVVLLGSSLWHKYDVGKALPRIRGRIYNYYSSHDAILAGPMKAFGTIDGVPFVDGAGAVGFSKTHGGRVVNIKWRREFEKFGYHGGHTDATNARFVQAYLATHLMVEPPPLPQKNVAIRTGTGPPAASSN